MLRSWGGGTKSGRVAVGRDDGANSTTAAKAALRRKKTHEHALEQTVAQIGTLEQQINSIESANINRETLAAMEKASQAMKQIHGKLTPERVDETMCVLGGQLDLRPILLALVRE